MGFNVSALVLSLLALVVGLLFLGAPPVGIPLVGVGALGLVLCLVQGLSEPAAKPAPPPHDAEARLRELGHLKEAGLISAAEWEARRKAILDQV
jgi:hypothetical protein